MMKALVMALGLLGGTALGYAAPSTAKCTFCPTYPCFGSCGSCSCMRTGSGPGQCVSISRVSEYEAHGYSEMR